MLDRRQDRMFGVCRNDYLPAQAVTDQAARIAVDWTDLSTLVWCQPKLMRFGIVADCEEVC
jgi:hypothetical protein